MVPFEDRNLEAYRLILRIEVVVRELLRATLYQQFGNSWRKRLPGELLRKVRASEADEDVRRQLGLVRLGPLYYLTIGELLEVLQRGPARPAVDRLGGDAFLAQLRVLFPVRNAVGHARDVSQTGIMFVRTLYQQMLTALSVEEVERLAAQPDVGLRVEEAARQLAPWLSDCLRALDDLGTPPSPPAILEEARHQYWWDADRNFEQFDVAQLESAIGVINEYNAISIGLGSRETRRRFVQERAPREMVQKAAASMQSAGSR